MDGGTSRGDLSDRTCRALERIAESLAQIVALQTQMLELEQMQHAPPAPEPEPTTGCPHPEESRVSLGDGEWACLTCRMQFLS